MANDTVANKWMDKMPPAPAKSPAYTPQRHAAPKKEVEVMKLRMARFEAELLEMNHMIAELLETKKAKKARPAEAPEG
jgi:hypothetical protein